MHIVFGSKTAKDVTAVATGLFGSTRLLEYEAQVERETGREFGISSTNVLKNVDSERMTIPPVGSSSSCLVVLSGDCFWEREHGVDVRIDLESGAIECAHEGAFIDDWDGLNGAKDWDVWSSKGRDWARREGHW